MIEFHGVNENAANIVGRSVFTCFVNPYEAGTFKRLVDLACHTGSPYTMPARVEIDEKRFELYLRIQKYGKDIMLLITRLTP